MSAAIHGHQVLELIVNSSAPWNLADLQSEVESRFGTQARFYTCSAREMTLDQLLDFLEDRRKISRSAGRIHSGASPMCNHS